jgi:hypothetical protein
MMNNQWLQTAILKLISGLPLQEAESVLFEVKQRLVVYQPVANIEKTVCPNTYRKPRLSKIERDAEMKEFILSLPYLNQADVIRACGERFGKARAPSSSGLSLFLMKQRPLQ